MEGEHLGGSAFRTCDSSVKKIASLDDALALPYRDPLVRVDIAKGVDPALRPADR